MNRSRNAALREGEERGGFRVIGEQKQALVLYPHSAEWEQDAARVIRSLGKLLAKKMLSSAHVGSTAIPHVRARGDLDILIAAAQPDEELVSRLRSAGYTYLPDRGREEECFFVRRMEGGRAVHLHVVPLGGPAWNDYIAFRDYLRGRPDIAREYDARKRELAQKGVLAYESGIAEWISSAMRRARLWVWLGKTVTVTVDRPLGSRHPEYPNVVYPVNYGYLAGVFGGDGREQDAYLLGVDRPVERYTGRVIAVIYRKGDSEDKLVVAPVGKILHQAQILERVWFMEQHFEIEMEHLYHRSCGMVVYRRRRGKPEYLLLQEKRSTVWSIPKGHMELGETEEQTAIRELEEEAGLRAVPIPGFRYELTYPIPPIYSKTLAVFLAECDGEVHVREDEIKRYIWVDYHGAKNHFGSRKMMDAIRSASRFLRERQKKDEE